MFHNKIRVDGEELLAPRPTFKLEDRPLSAVRDCLFNTFAATLHIGGRSSILNLRTRHALVTGTHLSRMKLRADWSQGMLAIIRCRIFCLSVLPVVLCGCETWSLTLREERSLRMFKIKVLRRIFGPKSDKVTRNWRKLHNGELHNLNSSPSIFWVMKSRRMRWEGHVARVRERRGVYRVLVRKPEGNRPLERPRRWWEDNIKMDHREVGYGGMDWIDVAEDRYSWRALVNAVMNFRLP